MFFKIAFFFFPLYLSYPSGMLSNKGGCLGVIVGGRLSHCKEKWSYLCEPEEERGGERLLSQNPVDEYSYGLFSRPS